MDSQNFTINNQQVTEWRYVFDQSVFWSLSSDLSKGTLTAFSVSDLFTSDSDYFVKFTYYPIRLDKFVALTPVSSITVGKKSNVSYTGFSIPQTPSYITLFSTTISRSFNNFLDYAPYTKIQLFVPYFNLVEIPPEVAYSGTLYGYVSLDFTNGSMTLYVYVGTKFVDSKTCKIGIDIALGKGNKQEQQRNNILQAITGIGSVVGLGVGVASGNPLITAGSVAMLTGNVTKYLQNNVDRLRSYNGGSGNRDMLAVDKTVKLIIERPYNVSQPTAHLRGRMMNRNASLSSLTGFTQIGEIHFEPKNYEIYNDEINEIVELLKTGVIL